MSFDPLRTKLVCVSLIAAGCAHQHPGQTSAEAHRSESAREQAAAQTHQSQYDPNASVSSGYASYNPTQWHLQEAVKHSTHAREHERAATKLEKFEEAECIGFSESARGACQLMGQIVAD